MDRRPTLETRPPVLIDAVVRMLIPPPCREHVVGDLWERYRSPLGYVLDAACTVPFVVASQIRRTSPWAAVVIQGFLLSMGFGIGSGRFQLVGIPVAAVMAALVLRDAYKSRPSLSAKQIVVDLMFPAVGVLVSQLVVALAAPQLLLPLRALLSGLVAFFILFLLRLQNPTLGVVPRQAMVQAPATLEALIIEVRLHERLGRRAIRIEALTGFALAVFFIVPLLYSTDWFLRMGWGLAMAYGLYVAVFMLWHRREPMPDGLGFRESLAHYRRELVRQHGFVQTMWLWSLLPGVPSILFIMIGAGVHAAERGRPAWPAAVMVAIVFGFGAIVHLSTRQIAEKVQTRIDALRAAEER